MGFTTLANIRLIGYILLMSTGIGLMFVALATPRRTASNYYFAIFASVLTTFSLTLMLRALPSAISIWSPDIVLRILTIHLILIITAFFSFVVYFLDNANYWVSWLMRSMWVIAIIGSLFVIFSNIFVFISDDGTQFTLNLVGILLVSLGVIYAFVTVIIVFQSTQSQATWLRVPSIAIAIAYLGTAFFPDLPVDVFLLMVGAVSAVYALMKQQIFVPMRILNRELSAKNSDLELTISQLKAEKDHVEQLNRDLIEAHRYQSEFLQNMSHELRTPLNSIVGYSELLTSPVYGKLNTQQKDRIERIQKNSKQLSALIDMVLDIDRIEADKLVLEMSEFRINPVIDSVVDRIMPACIRKDLKLVFDIEVGLPPLVADMRRVEQIVYNLLQNAVKFTHAGQIELTVSYLHVEAGQALDINLTIPHTLSDGSWMLFQVTDTGIGIAERNFSKIFVNFVQVDGSAQREFGGVGLGLAIAKQLVELHHGMIWVDSKLSVGSRFFVALPLPAQKSVIK